MDENLSKMHDYMDKHEWTSTTDSDDFYVLECKTCGQLKLVWKQRDHSIKQYGVIKLNV